MRLIVLALLYVKLCINADVIVCKDVCQYNASTITYSGSISVCNGVS